MQEINVQDSSLGFLVVSLIHLAPTFLPPLFQGIRQALPNVCLWISVSVSIRSCLRPIGPSHALPSPFPAPNSTLCPLS